jgi:hypothetical protein
MRLQRFFRRVSEWKFPRVNVSKLRCAPESGLDWNLVAMLPSGSVLNDTANISTSGTLQVPI